MAKGLINKSTLTAIADAIRAKTETTDLIIPEDMAAMIEGLSGCKVMSGSATPSASTDTLNLGATLPESDDYLFICVASIFSANSIYVSSTQVYTHYLRRVVIINADGVKSGGVVRTAYKGTGGTGYEESVSDAVMDLNGDSVIGASSETIKNNFRGGVNYKWWYAYG